MSVTRDVNLGTIVTILIFMITQSAGAIWLMAGMNSDIQAMRAWQVRQDDRLAALEGSQDTVISQTAAMAAILDLLRDDVVFMRQTLSEMNDGQ